MLIRQNKEKKKVKGRKESVNKTKQGKEKSQRKEEMKVLIRQNKEKKKVKGRKKGRCYKEKTRNIKKSKEERKVL